MADSKGIDEVKNVLNFLFQLGLQVEKVVEKGSVSLFDAVSFFGAFKAAGPALANLKDFVPELSDLNDQELADLRLYISENLKSGNASVDGLINDGLILAQSIYSFVEKIKLAKQPQAAPSP